jgi:hypothetical protein
MYTRRSLYPKSNSFLGYRMLVGGNFRRRFV